MDIKVKEGMKNPERMKERNRATLMIRKESGGEGEREKGGRTIKRV